MSGREMLEICTTSVQNPRPRHARFCIARAPSAYSFRERARREVISRGPTDKKRGLGGRLAGCARDVLLLSREPSHVGSSRGSMSVAQDIQDGRSASRNRRHPKWGHGRGGIMRLGGAGSGRAGRGGAQEEPWEAGIQVDGRGSVASLPLVGAQRAGFSSNDFRRWSDHRKTVVNVSSTHPQGSWAHASALPAAR